MERNRDEIDHLLEEAMRSYTPEPRPGLEARVLNHIRLDGKRRRLAWLPFAIAIPLLTTLLLVFHSPRHSPRPPTIVAAAGHSPAPALPAALAVTGKRHVRRARVVATRPDQFPTPSPLTPEEQALLRFVSRHPAEASEVAARQNEPEPAPIDIPALQIPPLSNSGGF